MKVTAEVWHVLVQESFVHMNSVPRQWTRPFVGVVLYKRQHGFLSLGERCGGRPTGSRESRLYVWIEGYFYSFTYSKYSYSA